VLDSLPLHIFPGGGFDQSILPVVYLGLLCLWFFAETFGFIFIGLIVPGYLTAVGVIAPASAAVVFLESLVTYGLVWGLSDGLGKRGVWSPFFGRDRFFAFLVISVVVRLVGGLWLWPTAWEWVTTRFGLSAAPPGPLSSLGLVLVPLTANMFWKVGIFRGTWQILLPTSLTYALTSYVLLPYTNLRFSEFRLNFEDVAVDLLSSSRTYIVLLVGAALSARLNKRYGWDFGGILVPALLAVTWYTPAKAAMTFAEVAVLATAAHLIVSAPVIKNWNLEGPRRLVLVFTVAFILKYTSSWVFVAVAPSVRMTDFFAFGYLLSSLVALKILQKDIASTVLPTVAVSLVGFVAGSLVALGIKASRLSSVQPAPLEMEGRSAAETRPALPALVRRSSLLRRGSEMRRPITAGQLRHVESIGKRIRQSFDGETAPEKLRGLEESVESLGLDWLPVEQASGEKGYLLAEPPENYPTIRGYGMYWFRPGGEGPVVQVPSPPRDAVHVLGLYAAADALDARALMLGTTSRSPDGQTVEPRRSPQSPYHRMHRTLGDLPVVQFRVGDRDTSSRIFVRDRLDHELPTETLEELFGSIPVTWNPPAAIDRQRDAAEGSFTSIRLDADDLLEAAEGFARVHLQGQDALATRESKDALPTMRVPTLQRHLESRLLGPDRRITSSVATLGDAPTEAELTAAARALVGRLTRLARNPEPSWREERIVWSVRAVARAFGLQVRRLVSRATDDCYWELAERERPLRGLGLVYVRCQAGAPLLVEVPKPLGERSTWRVGALMADGLDARGLVIGSWTRSGKTGMPRTAIHEPSMYVSAHRWLQRGYLTYQTPLAVQVRGLGADHRLEGDVLLSGDSPMWRQSAPGDLRALDRALADRGVAATWDGGRSAYTALRGFPDDTARYSRQVAGGRFARLWFAAPFRRKLTAGPAPDELADRLSRWQIDWREQPITEALTDDDIAPEATLETLRAAADKHARRIATFARTRSPVPLASALDELEQIGAAPRIVVDRTFEQTWVVASATAADRDGPVHLAIRIRPPIGRPVTAHLPRPATADELRLVTASRVWTTTFDEEATDGQ
jgi:hypothetical protein